MSLGLAASPYGMKTARLLCNTAKQLPNVQEGVACEGTKLESRTFRINKRAFLFVSPSYALVNNGMRWVKIEADDTRSADALATLVTTSYEVMVAKAPRRKPRATLSRTSAAD